MRIEINAGGLDDLIDIAAFGFSVEDLDDDIDKMISSFQAVKKAIYNLEGGVGKLDGAVNSLQKRIQTEENKRKNLADFSERFNDFLDLAVSIDREAAQLVRQNREEFYRLNEHLRPAIDVDLWQWNPLRILGEMCYDIAAFIVEGIIEYGDEIATVFITVGAVIAGVVIVVVTVATGGAAIFIVLGGALIGAGIGAGIAGYKSYKDDGDVNLDEVAAGFAIGFGVGGTITACLVGSASLAASGKVILGRVVSGAAAIPMDVFSQTLIEGENVTEGLMNYDVMQTIGEGVKSIALNVTLGALMDKFKWSDKLKTFTRGHLEGHIKSGRALTLLSKTPEHLIEAGVESVFDVTYSAIQGEESALTLENIGRTLGENIVMNLFFGAITDSFEYDIKRKKVLNNIEASRKAREASKFDSAYVDGFEVKQEVAKDVNNRFRYVDAKVDKISTTRNPFRDEYGPFKRSKIINDICRNTDGVTIKSHDLSSPSYKDAKVLERVLQDDLVQAQAKGDSLHLVVPNRDVRLPHLQVLNQFFQKARESGVDVVVRPLNVY